MRFSWSTYLLFLSLETLTFIIRTGLPILVELIDLVNSVIISNDLTQMVNFPTWSQAVIVIVLLFWTYFFLLMLVFFLQWLSLHWKVLIMLFFHLRDVPWEDIFKLGASAAASEFYEWVRVGIDVYISHRKYKASFISMIFSFLWCCHSS